MTIFGDRRLVCRHDEYISNEVMLLSEWYDYDSLHFVDEFLRDNDNFLDIGANVGLYTLLASRRNLKGIVCVEPGLRQSGGLRKNLHANGIKAEVFQIAVSDRNGFVELTSGDNIAHISLDMETHEGSGVERVETARLDDFLPDREYQLVKIDIEGFESPALRGAEKLIANCRLPAILFELNGSAERYGRRSEETAEILRAAGYVLGIYRHDAQEFDMTCKLWGDVLALNPAGLSTFKKRMPSVRFVGLQ